VVRSKLAAVRQIPGPVLVEDSGLFIPSLGGFPGVYSAPILKLWGFDPILELLRSRPREAYFEAVAGVRNGSQVRCFASRVHGAIAEAPRGQHGFGYDPIFVPDGWTRTFAEVPEPEKNRISHRGQTARKVARYLARRGASR
jgi:XTP/dITP diphosphohydrolase